MDEVITGFRVGYGGGQERLAVRADLTCLGKIVGGGLPAAAFGGRADVMGRLAPEGDVYQAGTLSGNPLAMAAGLATLALLRAPGAYDRLEATSAALEAGAARPGCHREPGRGDADRVLPPGAGALASPTPPRATPPASPASTPTCSPAASTSRRRSSRRSCRRSPTRPSRSSARRRPRAEFAG